jgi:hypothetical protein
VTQREKEKNGNLMVHSPKSFKGKQHLHIRGTLPNSGRVINIFVNAACGNWKRADSDRTSESHRFKLLCAHATDEK